MDHEEYLRRIKSYMKTPTKEVEQQLEDFCGLCTYISGQYDKDESFQGLNKHLEELESGRSETNRVFYMALPPSVFITVSQHLKKNCYPTKGIARVVVSALRDLVDVEADAGAGREAFRKGPCQFARTPKVPGS
jgi:glucose-6-phosphate 1-dehydrogenase